MDLATLRMFTTVVSEGGVSAAARKLHRVQSNVSTRIRQLEESLGVALFVRDRQRMALSPAGERFLAYANRILATWDEACVALGDDEPYGTLRLGTLESTAASRLPTLLARYHRDHPRVQVELVTGTTDALLAAVSGREVDAAFVADFDTDERLHGVRAFREELVLITEQGHAPVRRASDVQGASVIAFARGCAYRRRINRWLAEGGIKPARVLELSSYHAIVACVASGTGIAMVPQAVLATMRGVKVSVHPLRRPMRESTTTLVRRREPDSAATRCLVDMVSNSARRRAS